MRSLRLFLTLDHRGGKASDAHPPAGAHFGWRRPRSDGREEKRGGGLYAEHVGRARPHPRERKENGRRGSEEKGRIRPLL